MPRQTHFDVKSVAFERLNVECVRQVLVARVVVVVPLIKIVVALCITRMRPKPEDFVDDRVQLRIVG
jgi:hypothetical protein